MKIHTECKVSGSLSYILRVARVMGLAPLKFERIRDGWRIQVSRLCGLCGQWLVIICAVFSIVALISDLRGKRKTSVDSNSTANRIVWISDIGIVVIVNLAIACTSLNRMRYIVHSVALLEQINQKFYGFCQPSHPSNRQNNMIVMISLLVTCLNLSIHYGVFMYDMIHLNVITASFYIFYIICCVNLALYVIQFNQIVLYVLPSLQMLNKHLQNQLQMLYSDESSKPLSNPNVMPTNKGSREEAFNRLNYRSLSRVMDSFVGNIRQGETTTAATIHQLGLIYCTLADITRVLDDSNGVTLVVLLTSILLHLIITMYHLISDLFIQEQTYLIKTLMQLSMAVFHFGKLLLIVEPCHQTHEQMDLTSELVNQIRRYTCSEDLSSIAELKRFHRHIMLNQITYSPLELFTINRSFIAVILGSITTYLVIVIHL